MLPFRPPRRNLGQRLTDFAGGVTSGFAKQVVQEAEPAVRRIVRDERNRVAEALIYAIPFAGLSAIAFVGARYLADAPKIKAIGYGASAVSLAVGGFLAFNRLTETPEVPPSQQPTPSGPTAFDPVIQKAAVTLVAEAEPKVRAIVQEEKAKAVAAAQAAIPFAIASAASFVATMFLVKDDNETMKAVGYSGAALLLGAGAWIGLSKELEAVS